MYEVVSTNLHYSCTRHFLVMFMWNFLVRHVMAEYRMPSLLLASLISMVVFAPSPAIGQGEDFDRLDPALKQLLSSPELAESSRFAPVTRVLQGEALVDVFIRTTGGQTSFSVDGLTVKGISGDVVVASLPVSQLLNLTTHAGVRSIQSANVWKTMIDQSVPASNTLQVRNGYNVGGKDVIVGIIDTGIDPAQLDFRSLADDTRSRILYFWDMSRTDGQPPKGFESAGGTEIDSTFINAKLRIGDLFFANSDLNGHGTHVSGTAAGNGGGTQFIGMAPEADLVVVKATRGEASGSFSSADIITALNYIHHTAERLGKPYVINMSLGAVAGPADGSDAESAAIDNLVGAGKENKVVVVAAGNDGERRIHAQDTLSTDTGIDISKTFNIPVANATVGVQIWSAIDPNDVNKVFISVTGPDTTFGPVSGFPQAVSKQRDGDITVISSPHPFILTGTDIQTLVTISAKRPGDWTVSVRGDKGTGSGVVDMWLVDLSGVGVEFPPSEGNQRLLTGQPASTKNAITVGSYVTKTDWVDSRGFFHSRGVVVGSASTFSSPGPSRDGRRKPEISGPGEAIAAARATRVDPDSDNLLSDTRYTMLWGTSMATPHVTGAVALALEEARKRGVTVDAISIRDALTASAISDGDTGVTPNDKWGFGKLDVEAFFVALFGSPLSVTLSSFTAVADGGLVSLDWSITDASNHTGFQIYRSNTLGTAGRELLTPELLHGGNHLNFVDRPEEPGTYYYWLADVSAAGETTFHGPIVVTMPLVPSVFRLAQNAPNPFNPTTTLEYDLPKSAHTVLTIYDALGRQVRTLVDARQTAGFYKVSWNGLDQRGVPVGSGVYFYTLTAGEFATTKKMTLLK